MLSPGSQQCQKPLQHLGGSLGTAQLRLEEGEGQVAVSVAAAAAAAAEAARLDGVALEETAGIHTSRQSGSFQKATSFTSAKFEKKLKT